eukprot:29268-Pelagococcus_subviridis.AAC.5
MGPRRAPPRALPRSLALLLLLLLLLGVFPRPARALRPNALRPRLRASPRNARAHLARRVRALDAIASTEEDAPPPRPPPPARFLAQRLDHNDPAESRTWRQRYFLNDAWFLNDARPRRRRRLGEEEDGDGEQDASASDATEDAKNTSATAAARASPAIVFLCVGGEGPALRATVVTIGDAHCALAVETARRRNALVVALEHRFYGASQVRANANASLRANVALLMFLPTHQSPRARLPAAHRRLIDGVAQEVPLVVASARGHRALRDARERDVRTFRRRRALDRVRRQLPGRAGVVVAAQGALESI